MCENGAYGSIKKYTSRWEFAQAKERRHGTTKDGRLDETKLAAFFEQVLLTSAF